jgi:hypothetical protein
MMASVKPKVFISYSWLDEKDKDANPVVLAHGRSSRTPDERAFSLAELLREHGFDSRIDLYFKDAKYGFVPPVARPRDRRDPWIIWAQEQIAEADSVLLLCTPEYIASDPNHGECPGEWCDWHRMDNVLKSEKRVPSLWWDWHYIAKEFDAKPEKFIPVGFGSYSPEEIPAFVRGSTYCNLDSRRDFEGLLRRIREVHRRRHPLAMSNVAEQLVQTSEQSPGLVSQSATQLHVVILVHGIRDFALWQTTIRSAFEEEGFKAEATNYGRFNLLQFLLPFSYFRNKAITTVWNQIKIVKQNNEGSLLSVVAHSFGTFVVAHLMRENFDLKLHRVIFCGSVVRYGFPFEQFQNRFTQPIINEVGTRDIWPAIAESITLGYGSAGTYGFRRPLVRDRWHNGARHGYFLDAQFCKRFWSPFLRDGTFVPGAETPESPSLWLQSLSIVKIKYILTVLVLAFLLNITYNKLNFDNLGFLEFERGRPAIENLTHMALAPESSPADLAASIALALNSSVAFSSAGITASVSGHQIFLRMPNQITLKVASSPQGLVQVAAVPSNVLDTTGVLEITGTPHTGDSITIEAQAPTLSPIALMAH